MKARNTLLSLAIATGLSAAAMGAAHAEVLFWSTQANPPEEAQTMREKVLSNFEGGADFQPSEGGPWLTRIQAELQAGEGKIGVLGSLHGDLIELSDGLADLSDLDTSSVN